MNIHETIKEIREEKKFSQGYVTHNLGLSQSQYSRRESGVLKFLGNEIVLLSKILETPVSKLYDEAHNSFSVNTQNGGNFGQYVSIPDKIIEQYETRLREKDETIAFLRKEKS